MEIMSHENLGDREFIVGTETFRYSPVEQTGDNQFMSTGRGAWRDLWCRSVDVERISDGKKWRGGFHLTGSQLSQLPHLTEDGLKLAFSVWPPESIPTNFEIPIAHPTDDPTRHACAYFEPIEEDESPTLPPPTSSP